MTNRGYSIFITATDTGVGKTAVTAFLLRRLLANGIDATALKPVASGLTENNQNEDVMALISATGESKVENVNLYRFAMPAAPSLAAVAEGKSIDPERLIAWCRRRCQEHQICLIEGIGGLMVPLTPRFLVSNWVAGMPEAMVMLIVPAVLGAINHTLLTLAELKRIGRAPCWIIINDPVGGQQQMAAQIAEALYNHLAPNTSVLMLPYLDELVDGSEMAYIIDSWVESLIRLAEGHSK